jgi:hypothetical protein
MLVTDIDKSRHGLPDGAVNKMRYPATLATGEPSTVADGIVSRIRAGAYLEHAAAAVNVHKDTVFNWMRSGAGARTKVMSGHTPWEELTDHERDCVLFCDEMERAEAEWVVNAEATLEKYTRGGSVTTSTTVRKDPHGNVIETIEKTDVVPPKPEVLMWRLERKLPALYGKRTTQDINIGGQPGNPIVHDVDITSLTEKMKALAAGVDALDVDEIRLPAVHPGYGK